MAEQMASVIQNLKRELVDHVAKVAWYINVKIYIKGFNFLKEK